MDFVERAGEAATDARDRMGHIIKTVNSAQFNAKGMKPEAKLWCSANRGPQERQRPDHASKVRNVLHDARENPGGLGECHSAG